MKLRFDYSEQLRKDVDYFKDDNNNENDIQIKPLNINEKVRSREFNRQEAIDFKDAFLIMRNIAQINGDILEYTYDEGINRGELKYLCSNLILNVKSHIALFDCLKSATSVDFNVKDDTIAIVVAFNFNI